MDKTFDKLKDLIEKRKVRIKNSGSEIFIIWGVILLAGYIVKAFIIKSEWVFLITMISGIIAQVAFIAVKKKAKGHELLWNNTMSIMWIYTILIIILLGEVFPVYFKLYSDQAGTVLIYLFVCPALFISGLWLKKWSIKLSCFVFILASIFMVLPFPENKTIVIIAVIILGLIIPGIAGKLEEKYSRN